MELFSINLIFLRFKDISLPCLFNYPPTLQKGETAYKTDEPAEEGGGRHPLLLAKDQGRQCDRQIFKGRLPRLFHPLQRGLLVLLRPGGVNLTHTTHSPELYIGQQAHCECFLAHTEHGEQTELEYRVDYNLQAAGIFQSDVNQHRK